MNALRSILCTLYSLIFKKMECVCFEYSRSRETETSIQFISEYSNWKKCPNSFKKDIFKNFFLSTMYFRVLFNTALLICYSEDGVTLQGYGFIQKWGPFKNRFNFLSDGGAVMLGPFWTAPSERGRGIYGNLLARSVSLVSEEDRIFIYTKPLNKSSQRGIIKAGFSMKGMWMIRTWFNVVSINKRLK